MSDQDAADIELGERFVDALMQAMRGSEKERHRLALRFVALLLAVNEAGKLVKAKGPDGDLAPLAEAIESAKRVVESA